MTFKPQVLNAEINHELRWLGKLGIKGIFDREHFFIMEENANGKTIFRHGENFSGMIASILFGIIEDDTRKGFKAMNEALKIRVEANT